MPGRGAVDALEAAGPAGSVLVAFENAEGALHGTGVLARVQRVEQTSYGPRYVLRGVTRTLLDESKIREGDPPRAVAELLPERPEDQSPPPPALVATVAELASDWMGLDDWKDAFALLARSRLGQWATTLCVLMPLDQGERFELLDDPERMTERLQAKLERLLAVHSRRRVREAVVRETAPRDPKIVEEKLVAFPPASSTFLLFHPQDLNHRFGESPDWWRDGRIVSQEMEAGTLLGVDTESDGHLHLRVTAGGLLPEEAAHVAGVAEFRMEVTRGRLYVGSPRNLPSRMTDLFQRELGVAEAWVEVPRGSWRVTVHAITQWFTERELEGSVSSPVDYVLCFQPVLFGADVLPAPGLARLPVGGGTVVVRDR